MPPDAQVNILFIIPTLTSGGAERVITTILKYLDRAKFKLSLAVVDMHDEVYLDRVPVDVKLYDLNCRRVRYAPLKILPLIWKLRPHIIFTTLGHLNLILALCRFIIPSDIRIVARETSIPSHSLTNGLIGRILQKLYRKFYSRVDLLICQSRAMQDDMVANFKFPKSKTIVIHNPVETDLIYSLMGELSYKTNPNDIALVSAGRLSHVKGFDLLIEAIALLRNPHVKLTILGEGPELRRLKDLVCSMGVDSQVSFLGFQKNPFLWFRNADAFVLSSRYEGFPNVVLEALTCGTPVISTPAPGGVKEILHSLDACVVAGGVSAESLRDAILKWIEGPRTKIKSESVAQYAVKPTIDMIERVLLECARD